VSARGDLLEQRLEDSPRGLPSRAVANESVLGWEDQPGSRRGSQTVSSLRERLIATPSLGVHAIVIICAVVVGLATVPSVDPSQLGVLGLASVLGWKTYAAIGVLIVGFCIATVSQKSHGLLAGYVVSITVLLHGLAPLAYDHLRFPWAWKHVGIVDFILRHGGVDPAIESLNAYHNWPGFFGLNALIAETAGIENVLELAKWAPLFFNLLYLAALFLVFRNFTLDARVIWTGLLVFTLGNWVGQDYFAPQAVAYFFYLVIIGVLLQWFTADRPQTELLQEETESTLIAGLLLLLIAATVVTHQLTPVMLLVAVAGLAIFRRTIVRWPSVVTTVLMAVWLLGFARPFFDEYAPKVIADLAELGGRVESGLVDLGQVDTSQQLVSLGSRGATGLVLVLGALGFLSRRKMWKHWKAAVILGAAPLVLVAASSYGDEILFRAYLFILPIAAVLAGGIWFVHREPEDKSFTAVQMSATLLVLAFLSVVAQHGNDIYTTFTDDEVAAATIMYREAEPGSGVVQLSTAYPTNFLRYETLTALSVSTFSPAAKERFLADPDQVAARWLAEAEFTEGYVLVTRSQAADVTRRGKMPQGSPQEIIEDFRSSPLFESLYDTPDGVLFRLRGTP